MKKVLLFILLGAMFLGGFTALAAGDKDAKVYGPEEYKGQPLHMYNPQPEEYRGQQLHMYNPQPEEYHGQPLYDFNK